MDTFKSRCKTVEKYFTELWEFLTTYEIATDEELQLVTDIHGRTEETLLDVLYARTGYRTVENYILEEVCCSLTEFYEYWLGD